MILRYALLWFALAIIAIANGSLRVFTYGTVLSDLTAHQISTITGILLSGLFVYYVHRIWPIESTQQAWFIGIIWLISTILFEFGFGHYIAGHSWAHLLHDYNIFEGRVWSLFLLWVIIMPAVIYKYG